MSRKTLSVALIQERNHGDADANLAAIEQRVAEAAAQGAQLVLLQELHNGAYFCQHESVAEFDLAEPIPGPSTQRLGALAKKHASIVDVRGKGLMVAAELDSAELGKLTVAEMLKRHIVINCTSDTALRFLPPRHVPSTQARRSNPRPVRSPACARSCPADCNRQVSTDGRQGAPRPRKWPNQHPPRVAWTPVLGTSVRPSRSR